MESLKILSFGAGAIGTYIGGSLALAGHRVVFLERPEVVGFLQEHGLTLDLAADRKRWKSDGSVSSLLHPGNVEFYSDLEAVLSRGPFDFSIFALKSFDMDSAVEQMKPYVGKLPPVVCLSNGVENEAALATVFGRENVLAGTVTSSVGVRKIGHIVLERLRGVGIEEKHPLSLFISREMNRARLNAQLIRGPASLKWSKLLTNLPANATSAILNMSPDEVFSDPRLFKLEMQMLREALAVMRANRIRVVNLPHVPVMAFVIGTRLPVSISRSLMKKAVGGGRGAKMPSFHIDLHANRGRSEITWLNGAVVRFGELKGVPTPVNKILTDTLLSLVRKEIPLDEFSRIPEEFFRKFSNV